MHIFIGDGVAGALHERIQFLQARIVEIPTRKRYLYQEYMACWTNFANISDQILVVTNNFIHTSLAHDVIASAHKGNFCRFSSITSERTFS